MNFFEHQDKARRNTGRLVILFVLAVVLLIALTQLLAVAVLAYLNGLPLSDWQAIAGYFTWTRLLTISLVIVSVVLLASAYKFIQLSGGGRVVAEAMGGRLLDSNSEDADERKLLNVVEEMAIASGTPVPPVYLLEESAINAFAAGYRPADAVIGVTRGCIELLDRDELQGVIAHEFSHILHGDMRLNIRLIGVLHGILVLGIIGYFLLRSVSRTGYRSRSSKNNTALPFLALGAGLMAIGYVGTFFGNWIKAAVSRQREFLADSSAVQFTRNPQGISGALQKIGGFSSGSRLDHPHAAEISHLFFGQAVKPFFSRMMATHPPLGERISRIDPGWSRQFPVIGTGHTGHSQVETRAADSSQRVSAMQTTAGAVPGAAATQQSMGVVTGTAATQQSMAAVAGIAATQELVESIGVVDGAHLGYARQIIDQLPPAVMNAAREPYGARALVYCLLLDRDATIRTQQWQQLGKSADAMVFKLAQQLSRTPVMDVQFRLPVMELCVPALKQLSASQYQVFKGNVIALMQADQQIELFEWALHRILLHHLEPETAGLVNRGTVRSIKMVGKACGLLLSAVAAAGAEEGAAGLVQAEQSFEAAASLLGLSRLKFIPSADYQLRDLSRALAVLNRLQPLQKPRLLKALCACVTHDQLIKPLEVELIRALSVSLDCPMPPLLLDKEYR